MNRVHRSGVLARTAAEALVSLDMRGRVTDTNPAALRALLRSRDEIVGHHYRRSVQVLREDGTPLSANECPIQQVLGTERPLLAREVRLERGDGEPFHALLSASPILRGDAMEGAVILFLDITERKRMEEMAREERRRLYRILDNVTEGIMLVDPDGRFEYANPSAARMLDLDPDRLDGSYALEGRLFDLDGRRMAPSELPSQEAMRTRSPVRLGRFFVERSDGTRIAMETDASPILGEDGEPEGVVISFDDVTERLRIEEHSALLAALVETSDDMILLKSLDGTIREWNDAASRLLGYKAREIVGKNVRMLIPPEMQHEVDIVNERIAHGQKVPTFETERIAKDGSRIPVSVTVSAVRDRSGRVVALSATYRDIRDLVAKRRLLAESEQRYRSLFENDPSPVFTIDEGGDVVDANAAVQRILGYRAEEVRGTSFLPLIAPEDVERALENFARVLDGEARTDDYTVLRKDGGRVRARVTAIPVRVGDRFVGMHGRAQTLGD